MKKEIAEWVTHDAVEEKENSIVRAVMGSEKPLFPGKEYFLNGGFWGK